MHDQCQLQVYQWSGLWLLSVKTWQTGFTRCNYQFGVCQLPCPSPCKMKSWQIWKFQVKLDFWTSDFKVALNPPPLSKWKVGRFGSFKSSWILGLQISKCCFCPHPVKWKVGRFGSFEVKMDFWTSDFKVSLDIPIHPQNEKLADLAVWSQVGFLDFRFQSPALPHTHHPYYTPIKWKVGRFGSFKSSGIFWFQISKCLLKKISDLQVWSQFEVLDLGFESPAVPHPYPTETVKWKSLQILFQSPAWHPPPPQSQNEKLAYLEVWSQV